MLNQSEASAGPRCDANLKDKQVRRALAILHCGKRRRPWQAIRQPNTETGIVELSSAVRRARCLRLGTIRSRLRP